MDISAGGGADLSTLLDAFGGTNGNAPDSKRGSWGSAVGAGAGMAIGGPAGGAIGSALGPVLEEGWERGKEFLKDAAEFTQRKIAELKEAIHDSRNPDWMKARERARVQWGSAQHWSSQVNNPDAFDAMTRAILELDDEITKYRLRCDFFNPDVFLPDLGGDRSDPGWRFRGTLDDRYFFLDRPRKNAKKDFRQHYGTSVQFDDIRKACYSLKGYLSYRGEIYPIWLNALKAYDMPAFVEENLRRAIAVGAAEINRHVYEHKLRPDGSCPSGPCSADPLNTSKGRELVAALRQNQRKLFELTHLVVSAQLPQEGGPQQGFQLMTDSGGLPDLMGGAAVDFKPMDPTGGVSSSTKWIIGGAVALALVGGVYGYKKGWFK